MTTLEIEAVEWLVRQCGVYTDGTKAALRTLLRDALGDAEKWWTPKWYYGRPYCGECGAYLEPDRIGHGSHCPVLRYRAALKALGE